MSREDIKALVANAEADTPFDDSAIIYRKASDIQAKPINWLWKNKFARGKVSMLAGDPGLGKSQVTTSMAAIVTNGAAFPLCETTCAQSQVILLSAEDEASDTIVPRLKAVGAILERVFIIDAVIDHIDAEGNQIPKQFNLGKDLNRLDKLLTYINNVALIVIDPITAYLGDTDSHKTSDVRALLAPLSKLAEKHNVAIVCVSHLNKARSNDALSRVTGSLAFVAASRAAFVVVKDKDDPTKRLFLPMKNNIGNDQTGLSFTIESAVVASNIETSRIIWSQEPVSITANDAMSQPIEQEDRSDLKEAKDFLHDLLVEGAKPVKDIEKEADDAGIKWRTVERAKKELGAKAKKGITGSCWSWYMPVTDSEDRQGRQDIAHMNIGGLGGLDNLNLQPSN